MTIHSLVIQKLLSTNAHLGRRVVAHHFKVYICGSRNGIAILDSDKALICLRNACHFIGSPIRKKGRSLFVNTNSLFDEIMEQMSTRIGCINDSQWRIGGFLTNCSSPKKNPFEKQEDQFRVEPTTRLCSYFGWIESPRSYLKRIDHKYLLHLQRIRISHWDPIKESLIPFQRMILYSSYIYFVIRSRK